MTKFWSLPRITCSDSILLIKKNFDLISEKILGIQIASDFFNLYDENK